MGKYDVSEYSHLDRKSKKPLMEKKRRKRINDSLNVLKNLLLQIMHKDPAQTAKLEKADILAFTVDYLKKRQVELAYHLWAGWIECSEQILEYTKASNVDSQVKASLINHFATIRAAAIQKQASTILGMNVNSTPAVPLMISPCLPSTILPVATNSSVRRCTVITPPCLVSDDKLLSTSKVVNANSASFQDKNCWRPW